MADDGVKAEEQPTPPPGDVTEHRGEAVEAAPTTDHGEETGMKGLVEDLHARREKAKLGGGEEKIAIQHERGKLTARERIDLLVDPGTFVELGIHAGPHSAQRAMEGKEAPADGVITGWGDVAGPRGGRGPRGGGRRRPPVRDRRLRLHRDGGLDGDDRRVQDGAPPRAGTSEA